MPKDPPRRPSSPTPSQSGSARPSPFKAPPAEPRKAVPDGFVDPTEGLVFPQRRRRLR